MLGALVGFVVGQFRSRVSLVAENELLRQQLAAAKNRLQRKRVMFTGSQRLTIALLTRWTASWRPTVTLVQPATVLRWHWEGFRLLWRRRSRIRGRKPTSYATLIRAMAERNPRWGAERLRGELLKLGIRVSKRTVQRYMKKRVPRAQAAGQLVSVHARKWRSTSANSGQKSATTFNAAGPSGAISTV